MKTLSKRVFVCLTAFMILGGTVANAQQTSAPKPDNKGDRVEALRIAFISERLKLTPSEAQQFWPVYNAFRSDMESLRKNFKIGPGTPPPTADQALEFEQKKLDLKKQYKSQFEGTIGKEKVNTLFHTEEEFKQKLKEFRDQHRGPDNNRGGGQRQGPPAGGGPGGMGGPGGPGGGGMPPRPR